MAICVLLDLIFLEKRHFLSQRQLTNSRILFIFFLFIGCIFFCDSHLCGHKIPTAEEVNVTFLALYSIIAHRRIECTLTTAVPRSHTVTAHTGLAVDRVVRPICFLFAEKIDIF